MEITIESNPEDITREYIDGLISLGVNRFSIGVQTLSNLSLREIHRSDHDSILMALSAFQERDMTGISLSVDFIIGLPHVEYGETLRDIEYLHWVCPMITHTSIYLLEDELYPAHWASISMDQASRNQEYLDIQDFLGQKDWHHYEFSNWSRPWSECRHNQAYWNHTNYRGFGLSAASYIDGRRYTQSESFAWYYRGELAHDELLTPWDIELEELMFRMRTFSLPVEPYLHHPRLASLIAEWLIEIGDQYIIPTKTWIFLLDYIIGELV
jgi:oxygen-independent coproporphyrinogen III oxidase